MFNLNQRFFKRVKLNQQQKVQKVLQSSFLYYFQSLKKHPMQRQRGSQEAGARLKHHQKLERANQIFRCQCEKKYLTYAALYLHVKIKHGIRISNSKNSSNYKSQEIGNCKVHTYFLKKGYQGRNYNIINVDSENDVLPVRPQLTIPTFTLQIEKYLEQIRSVQNDDELNFVTSQFILKRFLQYLKKVSQIRDANEEKESNWDLALYFNEFAIFYIPTIKEKDNNELLKLQTIVKVLHLFWKWLKSNNYTVYDIISQTDIDRQQTE